MEFEAKREVLKELGIRKLDNLLELQTALWLYFTQDWLRLTVPSANDTNQTRWINHPLWDQITSVFEQEIEQPKLQRFSPTRLPLDDYLFVNGLGGFTSFMASRGIEDFGEGLGEYLAQANQFHIIKGEPFHSFVGRKVKAKARKYNTIRNQNNMADAARRLAEEAEAYRREKDGEDGDA